MRRLDGEKIGLSRPVGPEVKGGDRNEPSAESKTLDRMTKPDAKKPEGPNGPLLIRSGLFSFS
jgi:hypothetical protein